MPKKKKINPFWAFCMEFKKEHGIQSEEELKVKADAVWRGMSDEEKKQYAGKKTFKPLPKKDTPLTELEIEQNDKILFEMTMKNDIISELNAAKKYNNISDYKFYLVHINAFCPFNEGLKYPCEICISGFSLKHGVNQHDVFHSLISPGLLPPGYGGEAKIVSQQTHQLQWENDEIDNQEEVFNAVVEFLKNKTSSKKIPILYARHDKDLEIIQNVFQTWCDDYNPTLNFTIYNAEKLFCLLYESVVKNPEWQPDNLSCYAFSQDFHQFAPGIACEYHEEAQWPVHCSKSIAVRYCYIICEHCCPGLDIRLTRGAHVPINYSKVDSINKVDDETGSIVREETTDVESLSSLAKSNTYIGDSTASIGFPEDEFQEVKSRRTKNYNSGVHSLSQNLSSGLTLQTGPSGFSRKPAALSSMVTKEFERLTESQESNGRRNSEWPSIRGRGGYATRRGGGRGQPFRK